MKQNAYGIRRRGRAAWTMQGQLASGVTPQKDDSGLGLGVRRIGTTISQRRDRVTRAATSIWLPGAIPTRNTSTPVAILGYIRVDSVSYLDDNDMTTSLDEKVAGVS